MADTMEYKCPSCGGSMEFDSKTQKLKCPFCATEVGIEEWEDVQEEQAGMAAGGYLLGSYGRRFFLDS